MEDRIRTKQGDEETQEITDGETYSVEEDTLDELKRMNKMLAWAIFLIAGLLVWKLFEITSLMRQMRLY